MAAVGFPGIFLALFMLVIYGFVFWVVWKFYEVLAKMNENLDGIRRVMERGGNRSPGE